MHFFEIEMNGDSITGTQSARVLKGVLSGVADGAKVGFVSGMPCEGTRLSYSFSGAVPGRRMSRRCVLGEFGAARWTAVRA